MISSRLPKWEVSLGAAAVIWSLSIAASSALILIQQPAADPVPVLLGHLAVWILGAAGLGVGWSGLKRSESERNCMQEALTRSMELSRIVLESTNDAICIVNTADYSILGANHVLLQTLGAREEDVLGKRCHEVTHHFADPCSAGGNLCPLQRTVATGSMWVVEHLHYGKDSEKLFEEVTTYPIFDENQGVTRVLHVSRDISARKRAEDSIRQSNERYRAIFENTGTATIIVEEDNTISMANNQFELLSGCFKEEVEGKRSWTDFACKEDTERLMEYQRLLRPGSAAAPTSYEFRFVAAGNIVKEVSSTWGAIPGSKKRVGSFLDITRHKRIEEALRESEASLALAQKIAHLGSWEWDIAADVFRWSDELYRIAGISRKTGVSYESFLSIVHSEDKEIVNRSINEALYALKNFNMDFRLVLPDGRQRVVAGQGEVMFDDTGKPLRMIGTIQDVTWRSEAEEAVRKSEEKFSKAFHASPDWIVITRAEDGKYIEVNEAFLEITGYEREDVIGRTSVELGIWTDPRDRTMMLKVLNEYELVRNLEVSFCIKSGELRTMLWSAEVIEYNNEACLIAIARDVTEQRYLEKELLKSQAQLYIKHEELKNLFNQMETIRREWEQTLDVISDMFILVDGEGRIKRFNRAVEDYTGVAHRDIVGRLWREFLAEHHMQGNIEVPGVKVYNEHAGKWLVLNFHPFPDISAPGSAGGVVTVYDVSAGRGIDSGNVSPN